MLLGIGWRIPTYTEWNNANINGGWNNYFQTINSVLKLHAAGLLDGYNGSLIARGNFGDYWSNTQFSNTYGNLLFFFISGSYTGNNPKRDGCTIRCTYD